ncbi:MAG: transposase, partial [Anaerolineae bacterium]
MPIEPELHHRRSIRLAGYDYTQAGAYFVTVCTQGKIEFFGEVISERVHLNLLGNIVTRYWLALPSHFPNVILDEWVLMPNHLHGILILCESEGRGDASAVVTMRKDPSCV